MTQTLTELREQRLQKLFADCQQQVLSQIIGPFGLSTAMFADKNGGNVTTLHNFKRQDTDYVATESDKALHAQSKKQYNKDVRAEYEIKTNTNAEASGEAPWKTKRLNKINSGIDEYTGLAVSANGTIELSDGKTVRAELDHVVSISEVHNDPMMHLAMGKVTIDKETGQLKADVSQIRKIVNSDENLALTNKSLNGSKCDKDLEEWVATERKDGTTNAEKFDVDEERVEEKYKTAKSHIENNAKNGLFKKQKSELFSTGIDQAIRMGMRQALGLLLTELVNGLFNEFKVLLKQGVEAGKTLFEEIRQRLARVIMSVVRKIPDAVGQMFQGGISGFMSNLLTFLINNFISTAKRFVTVIREGLLGLFRAFKMIFFPPKHMTGDQALQEGLKILTTVVITSVGILLNETVATFMATVPFLKPFADSITSVLIGIMTGLLSAFLAYQIDCLFDRYKHSLSEKFMNELLTDAKRRDEFTSELVTLSETSLGNIENYSKSVSLYQDIGATLGSAGLATCATLASLEKTVAETSEQVTKSRAMITFINESQSEIEDFLKNI